MLRRQFLTNSGLVMSAGALVPVGQSAWPVHVAKLGAVADGKTLSTRILQSAIDQAFQAGGGVVYVPPGKYLTGGLELKSRVTLYLEAGATLLGSTKMADYVMHGGGPSVRGDSNGHHLIFARGADDIALCGLGTIDGEGSAFWSRSDHSAPPAGEEYTDSSAFYWKATEDRPSPMVEFAECRNVHVQDITLTGAAGWTIRPVACDSVFIDGMRIRNPIYGPNTDGLDITASSNVFVSNCDISTGDDAICIKSENPYGPVLPTKNITITNCRLTTCCNGLKLGTATHGSYENITFTNSVIDSDSDPIHARVIGGINLEMVDGGSIDGVIISNIQMRNTRTPIFIRLGSRTPSANSFVRNVLIRGIQASGALLTSSITGLENLRVTDVTLSDIRLRTTEVGHEAWRHLVIDERPQQYPESRMFGRLPAYGLYVRHADRITMRNVELITDQPDGRPAIVMDDVSEVAISGLLASAPKGTAPLLDLRNVRSAFVHGCRAPAGLDSFAEVSGVDSKGSFFSGNEISGAVEEVRYANGAIREKMKPGDAG
jgi:polygalacturonase